MEGSETAEAETAELGAEDPVEVAWAKLEAEWSDDDAHKAFIGLCMSLDRLPDAGRRYRAVADDDPERAESAQKRIGAILAIAMRTMELGRTTPSEEPKRRLLVVAFLLSVSLVGYALWEYLRAG